MAPGKPAIGISGSPILVDWRAGTLAGAAVRQSSKTLGQMPGLFRDETARQRLDPETLVYRVQSWQPVRAGTEGGLFWGTTIVEPGKVGAEYFMTHGHYHHIRNRGEYYATVQGEGALILMAESGETRGETMSPGTIHYIPGNTAHRVANTSKTQLVFLASWPSDAGYDYDLIRRTGFGASLIEVDGKPALVPNR
jgi:glucose-6-phosphate isomerase, archaeal